MHPVIKLMEAFMPDSRIGRVHPSALTTLKFQDIVYIVRANDALIRFVMDQYILVLRT